MSKDVAIVNAEAAKEEKVAVARAASDYHGTPMRRPAKMSWARAVPCGK